MHRGKITNEVIIVDIYYFTQATLRKDESNKLFTK